MPAIDSQAGSESVILRKISILEDKISEMGDLHAELRSITEIVRVERPRATGEEGDADKAEESAVVRKLSDRICQCDRLIAEMKVTLAEFEL